MRIMKVLIATPLYPPDIGGPATYSAGLEKAFSEMGYEIRVVTPEKERMLPSGLRHFFYFFRLWRAFDHNDVILALDTFSVGLPALFIARLNGASFIVRIGGDFLWEMFIARTKANCTLKQFYENIPELSIKEKFIFHATAYLLSHTTKIIFSTAWQRDIWVNTYKISGDRTAVVENAFTKKEKNTPLLNIKSFLWAGRRISLKNIDFLERAFLKAKQEVPDIILDIAPTLSPESLQERIKSSYALLLPSLTDISPNFILDGLALGKPFIMTEETGIRTLTKGCGIFLNPLDEEAWAEGIAQMADETNYRTFLDHIDTLRGGRSYVDIAKEIINFLKKT